MIEAVLWLIIASNDSISEMEMKVYFKTMAACKEEESILNMGAGVRHPYADGWYLKSATCARFMEPLVPPVR